jgi:hypothetical protein
MSGLRLVVLGMMGRCPFGGQTWLYLNWLRGLDQLGHEVWYVEDDSVWPYDPLREMISADTSYAVRHIDDSLARIGLGGRWAYRLRGGSESAIGLDDESLAELYRTCDALLNVGGATDLSDEQLTAPFRIYVQTDPVTAELRLAAGDEHTRKAFADHHVLATYGENYGAPDCSVPLNGHGYVKTRQPIDLALWPMAFDPDAPLFTTIGNYRQEGDDVEYEGEVYRWSKHHEWEQLIDLPAQTSQPLAMAVSQATDADRSRLERHGWRIVPSLPMSLDVFGAYADFVRGSRAELTVAKDQNVRLRSGWFSERDACYLASGKPVVAQDTGFSNVLPTGAGLFAFATAAEATEAIEEINSDYGRHCDAARALAEEYFRAPLVASRLLQDVGAG